MRIQYLAGGLGNQILQYVFARYIERRSPQQPVIFDDAYFFMDNPEPHNGYELESVFGVHLNLLSRCTEPEVWEKILYLKRKKVFLPQVLLDSGLPIMVVSQIMDTTSFRGLTVLQNQITPEVWNLPYRHIYYFDHWHGDYWFEQDREEDLAELAFPPLEDDKSLEYAEQIQNHFSVGIHVRRRTFVTEGWAAPEVEYLRSCKKIANQYPDTWFFIFSDELNWCKANAEDLGFNLAAHTVYVEGNVQKKSYMDMQLLSMCRGIIRPGMSTFSQIAARFARSLEFEVVLGEEILEFLKIPPNPLFENSYCHTKRLMMKTE